jgi:hypothetical protein
MKAIEIINQINNGKTLYITTYLRSIKVDLKTLKRWEKSGVPLFKDGKAKEPGFYIGSGRHYDYVNPEWVSVKFI